MDNNENKPLKVLSLDGGGMRGLYSATFLNTLACRFGNGEELDIGKGFDLIVGTSTGGILGAGLVAGVSLTRITDIYRKHGKIIFSNPIPSSSFKKLWWAIKNIKNPANSNLILLEALTEIFGTEKLGDLYKRRKIPLCITSLNLATHKTQVFKTAHISEKFADDERLVRDICIATSAAPIIFPIAGIPNPHINDQFSYFVDGGLWANNPILVALVEALVIAKPEQEIQIISIGTCPPPSGSALTADEANRGILGWNVGIKALELSMDAQASGSMFIADFLARSFNELGKKIKIIRVDQATPSTEQANLLSLDNASEKACSTLIELGTTDALAAYGKAIKGEGDYAIFNDIFKRIPKLEKIKE